MLNILLPLPLGCGHDPDAPRCEAYCTEDCDSLERTGGGDLATECGSCVGARYNCRPGRGLEGTA